MPQTSEYTRLLAHGLGKPDLYGAEHDFAALRDADLQLNAEEVVARARTIRRSFYNLAQPEDDVTAPEDEIKALVESAHRTSATNRLFFFETLDFVKRLAGHQPSSQRFREAFQKKTTEQYLDGIEQQFEAGNPAPPEKADFTKRLQVARAEEKPDFDKRMRTAQGKAYQSYAESQLRNLPQPSTSYPASPAEIKQAADKIKKDFVTGLSLLDLDTQEQERRMGEFNGRLKEAQEQANGNTARVRISILRDIEAGKEPKPIIVEQVERIANPIKAQFKASKETLDEETSTVIKEVTEFANRLCGEITLSDIERVIGNQSAPDDPLTDTLTSSQIISLIEKARNYYAGSGNIEPDIEKKLSVLKAFCGRQEALRSLERFEQILEREDRWADPDSLVDHASKIRTDYFDNGGIISPELENRFDKVDREARRQIAAILLFRLKRGEVGSSPDAITKMANDIRSNFAASAQETAETSGQLADHDLENEIERAEKDAHKSKAEERLSELRGPESKISIDSQGTWLSVRNELCENLRLAGETVNESRIDAAGQRAYQRTVARVIERYKTRPPENRASAQSALRALLMLSEVKLECPDVLSAELDDLRDELEAAKATLPAKFPKGKPGKKLTT